MPKFEVGDKVTMVAGSRYEGRDNKYNPVNGTVGIVKRVTSGRAPFAGDTIYTVNWPSGCANTYENEDLQFAPEFFLGVWDCSCEELQRALQEVFLAHGIKWCSGRTDVRLVGSIGHRHLRVLSYEGRYAFQCPSEAMPITRSINELLEKL